jgi:DNA polymerase/3'-5' exonuclease PolX
MEKMKEYVETGTLQLLEREKQNPENILSDVYGIGPQKAKELVQNGITNIDQLRDKQDNVLNKVQQIGLKYYDDILQRIPRDEIDKYNTVFTDVIQNLSGKPKMNYEIVGSYRRGLSTSGDIDVIITTLNVCAFDNFLDELIRKKLILEVLSRGKSKCLVIMKLPRHRIARRVDFLLSTPTEYPFSVLYFTGSKSFNYTMRAHALRMGFSMNEHGMIVVSDKQQVDHVFDNERSIFDFLQLQYKTPEERTDGRAVVAISNNKQSKLE